MTQGRWPAHLKDVERLHCYAASRASHHYPAYRCAIAITCAQDILKSLLQSSAGMANQEVSEQMSADGLGWVLEVSSRLADLPLTWHTPVYRYLFHGERDCIIKLDDSLALNHSNAQMPRQLPR